MIGNNSSSAAFIHTKEEQILGFAQVDFRIMPRYSKLSFAFRNSC